MFLRTGQIFTENKNIGQWAAARKNYQQNRAIGHRKAFYAIHFKRIFKPGCDMGLPFRRRRILPTEMEGEVLHGPHGFSHSCRITIP